MIINSMEDLGLLTYESSRTCNIVKYTNPRAICKITRLLLRYKTIQNQKHNIHHWSSGPIDFLPALSTFRLFFSAGSLGSFLIIESASVCSSPSWASLAEPLTGDATDLVSAVSEWRASLPREMLIDCDSGLLDWGFVTLEETPGEACLVATPRYWYLSAMPEVSI